MAAAVGAEAASRFLLESDGMVPFQPGETLLAGVPKALIVVEVGFAAEMT